MLLVPDTESRTQMASLGPSAFYKGPFGNTDTAGTNAWQTGTTAQTLLWGTTLSTNPTLPPPDELPLILFADIGVYNTQNWGSLLQGALRANRQAEDAWFIHSDSFMQRQRLTDPSHVPGSSHSAGNKAESPCPPRVRSLAGSKQPTKCTQDFICDFNVTIKGIFSKSQKDRRRTEKKDRGRSRNASVMNGLGDTLHSGRS